MKNSSLRVVALGKVVLPVAMIALLSGCDLFTSGASSSELDEAMEAALIAASPTGSIDYFELPLSNDYASIPQDPRNPLTPAKVELGKFLFHETALNISPRNELGMGTSSCAACHHAAAGFQAGRAQGIGEGGWGFGGNGLDRIADPNYDELDVDVQPIRSPSAMNGAYQAVNLWNGQFGATGPNEGTEDRWFEGTPIHTNFLGYEGLETQAIAALTVHRLNDVENSEIGQIRKYVELFNEAFPGQGISNETAGLAIGAYERTLLSTKAPFQLWLRGQRKAMTAEEKVGATLFFGKANCSTCHTGPSLADMNFYALGMNELEGPDVIGPTGGAALGRATFSGKEEDNYKFKTPQLYNLTDSPFYGHGATFTSIREVVEYKNNAVPENAAVPVGQLAEEFKPLGLTEYEIDAITAFLSTGLHDKDLARFAPKRLPSGNCPIVNDTQSRYDLGCDELPS